MPNGRRFWLLFSAASAGILAAVLWLGPYREYCQSNPSERQHCVAYKVAGTLGEFIGDNSGAITALATFAIALFTWTLWRSNEKMWIATNNALRHADITARHQLRAYLFNGHANIIDFDGVPIAQVLIKNAGQTPAHDIVAWNAVQLLPFPLDRDLHKSGDVERIRGNLGPGMDLHLTTRCGQLPDEIRASIRAGTHALYVFGRADYIDAFGCERFLEWCLYYGEDSARRTDGSLSVYPQGTKAN